MSPLLLRSMEGLKTTGHAMLARVPLRIWQRLLPKDVIALGYHVVSDEDLPHIKYYAYKNCRQFESDVAYIAERQKLTDYRDLLVRRRHEVGHPSNSFLFTFDDGYAECFHNIRPILKKHGVGGVFFLTTRFLDDRTIFFENKVSLCLAEIETMGASRARCLVETLGLDGSPHRPVRANDPRLALNRLQQARIAPPAGPDHRTLILWFLGFEQDGEAEIDRACEVFGVDPAGYSRRRPLYLTSDQARQLAEEGFTLGSHGVSHLPCQRKDPDELEREIVASCRMVCDITGQKSVPFAFPYSGEGIDRAFLSGLLEHHKFIDLFFDTRGLSRDAPFIVNRLSVDSPDGAVDGATNLDRLMRSTWSRRSAW